MNKPEEQNEIESDNGVEEKYFECLNDLKEYYQKNKDKLDKMTTVLLNKLYKINGYIIRKNYGEIGFKTIKSTEKVSKTENV